jgi:hypothetical protein
MKKTYVKPAVDVVEYGMTQIICSSNQVKSVDSGDTGLKYGGGGSGGARSKDRGGIWDED